MMYIIHSCLERLWYVEEFMIPSMIAQGISRDSIYNLVDREHRGVLVTTMESFGEQPRNAWHLQDDVLISSEFRKQTELQRDIVACGYCSAYIQGKPSGFTDIRNIWYSFPCIYIPKRFANECSQWFYDEACKNPAYKEWVSFGKHVDEFFKIYMIEHYPNSRVLNMNPNIVEHIDWLIGGSTINKDKQGLRRSKYWTEPQLVTVLENQLKERNEWHPDSV